MRTGRSILASLTLVAIAGREALGDDPRVQALQPQAVPVHPKEQRLNLIVVEILEEHLGQAIRVEWWSARRRRAESLRL